MMGISFCFLWEVQLICFLQHLHFLSPLSEITTIVEGFIPYYIIGFFFLCYNKQIGNIWL